MRNWTRGLLWILVLLLSAPLALAQDMPSVKLGVQPWLGYGPWWIAQEKGFFAARGLEVEVVNFTWDQDITAALASGQIDFTSSATNTLIALINQGVDVQGVLVLDSSYEADAILAPDTITSITDLKGKKIAYEQGATSDLLLNYALGQNGMTIADVEPVPMAAADAGAALIAGRVDVAVTYEPYISAALRNREGFGVLYTAAEKPGLISDMMVSNREYIAANPTVIEAMAWAWDDSVKYLRENPDEGGQIIADAVGSPLEEFQVAFEGVRVYDLAENVAMLQGDFQDSFTTIGQIMMETNPDAIIMIPDPADALAIDYLLAMEPMATEETSS